MNFLQKPPHFDFMSKRKLTALFSALLLVASVAALSLNGLEWGIDFTGGTLVELGYSQSVELEPIQKKLRAEGFTDFTVQHFGTSNEVLIRLAPIKGEEKRNSAKLSERVLDALNPDRVDDIKMRRVEFVGPQVGEELREDGGLAMVYALIAILIYVGMRFEYRFALGAVAALVHDVLITLGIFSFFQLEFNLSVLAAILAVIGYSLNDTIVVFDRIRENFRKMRKGAPIEIINTSLNQTLGRTLMTSLTTLLVLTALFLVGGEIIHHFALALIIGVFIGTYSSIYVASSTILVLNISKRDLMPPKKEGENTRRSDGAMV